MSCSPRPLLTAAAYTGCSTLEREHAEHFEPGWVSVALACQVPRPGDVLPVTVAGRPLLVTRDAGGTIHVLHNACRHRGLLLVDAPANGLSILRCPYHAWCYGLDGALKRTPYWDGSPRSGPEEKTRRGLGLIPVRSVTWAEVVFANLNGDAPPFERFIEPLAEHWSGFDLRLLRHAAWHEFRMEANWKLVCENFLDGYHVPWVHGQVGPPEAAVCFENLELSGDIFGFLMPRGEADKPKPTMPTFPDVPGALASTQHLLRLFPNTLLILTPSWFQVIIVVPDGVAATRETFAVYVVGDEAIAAHHDEARQRLVESLAAVNAQDAPILKRLQAGRASPAADRLAFAPFWDGAGYAFHRRATLPYL